MSSELQRIKARIAGAYDEQSYEAAVRRQREYAREARRDQAAAAKMAQETMRAHLKAMDDIKEGILAKL